MMAPMMMAVMMPVMVISSHSSLAGRPHDLCEALGSTPSGGAHRAGGLDTRSVIGTWSPV
jgi:hypothetical protein